jgi:flagellar biosynthesis/type III secretory pathway M-ring protein FliF/YscJ
LLLDQEVRWEGTGKNMKRVLASPSPERLKAINDVVAGVLGLQTDRGDRLVIQSLPFEQTLMAENTASEQTQDKKQGGNPKDQVSNLMHDKRVLIGAAVGGVLVFAALAFLFLRGKKKQGQAEAVVQTQLQSAQKGDALNPAAGSKPETDLVLSPASDEDDTENMLFPKLQIPAKSKRYEELRHYIKESVTREPQLAADILRDWLSESH